MNSPETATTDEKPSKQGGWGFALPAVVPGLLFWAGAAATPATAIGLVVSAAVSSTVTAGIIPSKGSTAAKCAAYAAGCAAVAGVFLGGGLIVNSVANFSAAGLGLGVVGGGVMGLGFGALGLTLPVIVGIAGASHVADHKKYNPKKVFSGTLTGAALSAILANPAIQLKPTPLVAEETPPPSTLHIESRGGGLCDKFKLTEDVAAVEVADGKKVYKLVVPKDCALN